MTLIAGESLQYTLFEQKCHIPILQGDQELLTLPEHPSSPPPPGFSGVHVTRSLVLYVCFLDRCLSFCTFSLAIALSVLRCTDSNPTKNQGRG
jgi:hypothetical protein